MGGPVVCVLVSLGFSMALAMPPMDAEGGVPLSADIPRPRQDLPSEDFSGGFSKDFAQDLPTREFMSDFQSRYKRQVGVSSAIDSILNTPYKHELESNHLQALLTRNSLARPARESTPLVSSSSRLVEQPPIVRPSSSTDKPPFVRPPSSINKPPTVTIRIPTPSQSVTLSQQTRSPQRQISLERHESFANRFQPSFGPSNSFAQQRQETLKDPLSHQRFSSTSFTGQQFKTPFPNFGRPFFESSRANRKKRDVKARQGISSQITSIIRSPYGGSVPSSIASLLNRNNRFPRKSQANSEQSHIEVVENDNKLLQNPSKVTEVVNDNKQLQSTTSTRNPFEIPFTIPNFFRNLGIRRRSLNIAEERQGISDALDGIIYAPYEGSRPSSIQSLFANNRNRFVRKTQPNPQPDPNPFPSPQPQPFPRPGASARPQPVPHRQPVSSNNPFEAAGRLFPKSNGYPTNFEVSLPSGHSTFRSIAGRQKRSTNLKRPDHTRRSRRLLSHGQRLGPNERVPRRAFPTSPNRYRMSLFPNDNQKLFKKPSFDQEIEFNDVYENGENNSPEFTGVNSIKPLDFLTNFNTPFEREIKYETPRDHLEISALREEEQDALSIHKSTRPQRRMPPYRFSRPVRQMLVTAPGLRPGPSPPAHILPPSSSVRAPRHIIVENRRLPKSTRQQDIPIIRRSLEVAESKQTEEIVPSDVEAAKQESNGFMDSGNGFPSFETIGGFAPMSAADSGKAGDSFVPEFRIPVVNIPDIPDNQPQFNLPQFTQQKQGSLTLYREDLREQKLNSQTRASRRRRRAGEPDPLEDPSTVPHKRVHRVQSESQIPHSRNPREFEIISDSQAAFSDIPYHIEPFPAFEFPVFQSERIASSRRHGGESSTGSHPRGVAPHRHVEIKTSDDDFIVPESQRFYPTFNPRFTAPTHPSTRQPFFPLPSPRTPGPRNTRFNGHGPGFRESPSIRDNRGFRDFHDTFYGPGAHEAINRPDFAFPSSKRPTHREEEYLDNTLLGSGNFEILRGGTFYDEDDHEFDHLLHEGYYGSHASHNIPHSNNHVDDFFSNFRDFSEFAARRSDNGEPVLDDPSYYGHGFASEHIQQVINSSHPDFPSAVKNTKTQDDVVIEDKKTEDKAGKQTINEHTKDNKAKVLDKGSGKYKFQMKHRPPKNIQDVLADLEAQPSDYALKPLTVDESDPMIAMF